MTTFNLQEAIDALKSGKTILYPTDTIWGIGCDATNEVACQRVLEIKNRPHDKSFVLLADGFNMIEKYIPQFPQVVYDLVDLAEKPLTVIYPDAIDLASSVLAEDGSVGIRIPKDPICLALIRALGKPLVSTSANVSGEPSPTCFDDITDPIKNGVDYIVKERLTEKRTKSSEIIKIGLDSGFEIIRR